jgi:hypothetical protein
MSFDETTLMSFDNLCNSNLAQGAEPCAKKSVILKVGMPAKPACNG